MSRLNTRWAAGTLAVVLVVIIISAAYNAHKDRILMEKGIAQAKADSAQYARVEKATQQAKEVEEKKKFDELPAASKARIHLGRVIEAAYRSDVGFCDRRQIRRLGATFSLNF